MAFRRRLASFALACLFWDPVVSLAAVINPGFDQGATGFASWQFSGELVNTGQQAALLDSGLGRTYIWQTLEGPDGPAIFSFDFLLSLTGVGLPGSVPDVMFASLYFFSDAGAFDPGDFSSFSNVIAVADFDSHGADNPTAVSPGVVISPSTKGSSYRHLAFQFQHPGGKLAPVFEVNNLNGVVGDSLAAIDNVTLTVVPEPASLLLLLMVCPLLLRRHRKGKISC